MRRFIFILFLLFFPALFSTSFNRTSAATGEELFQSLGCGSCHKPEKKATAISLSTISSRYQTPENLVKLFKGESKPMIEEELPKMMKGPMGKIGALPEEEKKALAAYILGFK